MAERERGANKWETWGIEARRLYVEEELSVTRVFEALQKQISTTTLYIWRRDDNWEQRRKAYRGSVKHAVSVLKNKILEIVNQLEDKSVADSAGLADTLSKLDKILDRFEARRDPRAETINVMDDFANWLSATGNAEALAVLGTLIQGFVAHVLNRTRN